MAKPKQITVRIGDGLEAVIQRIVDNTNDSQSTVIRAMLAYAAESPRDVEMKIREHQRAQL